MTELPKLTQNDLRRPKVFLRRFTDPLKRLAILEYILNRKKAGEGLAMENMRKVLGG